MLDLIAKMKSAQAEADSCRSKLVTEITKVLEHNLLKLINLNGGYIEVYCPQGILEEGQPFIIDLSSPEWQGLLFTHSLSLGEEA